MAVTGEPYVPQYMTVHLGRPDEEAENVTVSFVDYIKNVASSEIYPTWPESALRANIYAQISYALNRFYTEWYRSQGYDFDITNTTQFDQAYVHNRDIFDNIAQLVDEIFNDYIRKQGSIEPYFAAFCNGTTTTCDGLSQWGTVELANRGYVPYDILTYYYGKDIDIVRDAPVAIPAPSYPGYPLNPGDSGNNVKTIQVQLNRISRNFPKIPKISPVNGVYSRSTQDAVEEFQRVFNLPVTGVVDKSTWYQISYIYVSVKKISELDSEGVSQEEISRQYPNQLVRGGTGVGVRSMQYFLAVIAQFYDSVPPFAVSGIFDPATEEAVKAFQKTFGLPATGIVDNRTWTDIYRAYRGIVADTPFFGSFALFPGEVLSQGSQGEAVKQIQTYLSVISDTYPEIPKVSVTGLFGPQTQNAVIQFQQRFGMPADGIVGPVTWGRIAELYSSLTSGFIKEDGQFPGYELKEE